MAINNNVNDKGDWRKPRSEKINISGYFYNVIEKDKEDLKKIQFELVNGDSGIGPIEFQNSEEQIVIKAYDNEKER